MRSSGTLPRRRRLIERDLPDMPCRELVELITDYLEDRLSPIDRARFEAHLAECEPCRTYLEQFRQMIRVLRPSRRQRRSISSPRSTPSTIRPRHDVLRAIREALRPDGVFLMVDIAASSHLERNVDNPLALFLFTVSTMHCMTVSLAQAVRGWARVGARRRRASSWPRRGSSPSTCRESREIR
jgi:anti-sigma factor RsiW